MNYIAIKEDSFVIIQSESEEQELINQGYTLYSSQGYADYISNANKKTLNQIMSDLEEKADEYTSYGYELWKDVTKKVFAINTYNKSIGIELTVDQMKNLLALSDLLEKSLKTGSFNTAKDISLGFKQAMPQYGSVCDYIISSLNKFMGL